MITKQRTLSLLIVIISIILASCGKEQEVVEPTATLPPTATFTPAPTFTPSPTFTLTATPTPRIPVLPGTQMPASGAVISADNIDQVVELARWGKGVITDVVYSPDGKSIAVATTLGVSLYQTDTLDEILYFETDASVNSLVYSPDGETIATGLSDNTVKIWKASDGSLLKSFDGHVDETPKKGTEKPEVTSIAFSPDGNLLAGGSTDSTVSLWQVLDGSLVNTLKNHTQRVTRVLFSPDGQSLFSSSQDGNTRMVNVSDGKLVRTFAGRFIVDATISTDGKTLATYDSFLYKLILWDVQSGKKSTTISGLGAYISAIALSPNGQSVAAAFEDYTAEIWSVPDGVLQNTFEDIQPKDGWYYYENFNLSFSQDSQSLLMAGIDIVGLWDVKKGTLSNSSKIKSEGVYDLDFSPDGQTLASVEGANVNLWKFPDGILKPSQDLLQSNRNVDFSPDGATLLVPMFDSTARLWPLSDNGIKKSFETEKREYIRAVAFSPNGQIVALEEIYTGKVELRQVSDGSLIKSIQVGTTYGIGSVIFSSDSKYLAVALNDKVRLFQVEDWKTLKDFKGGLDIAFSPDGTLLAGGGRDKTINVWNIPKGDILFTIKDRPAEIAAVIFSPAGKFLATGYADGTIEVFLASDGTLLKSWKGHPRGITDLIFTSDSKLLISSSWDGTIRMWGLKP